MKIKSIRYGFANNSSSSHSIVFLGSQKVEDNDIYEDFGWSFFTAASEQAKKDYLLATILHQRKIVSYIPRTPLTEKSGWSNPFEEMEVMKKYKITNWDELRKSKFQNNFDLADSIEEKLKWGFIKENFSDIFGNEMLQDWEERSSTGQWGATPYIDHQSVLALPINPDGSIQVEFLKTFFSILIKENFAILGGNDNDDVSHSLYSKNTFSDNKSIMNVLKIIDMMGTENVGPVCVYDELNKDFIFQKSENGNKIRFSLDSNEVTNKSSFPELVDLKITEYCDYGCKFCYQSSTKEGSHASFENVEKSIKMLAASGVLEIAIGGGEPTQHPDLLKILQLIKSFNMSACFTTKNFDIQEHPDYLEILKASNSIAFSCNSIAEIEKIENIKNEMINLGLSYESRPKIYIQMIPELMSDENFEKALKYVSDMYNTPVTLLGYKDFGFGEKYLPKNRFSNSGWIKTVKEFSDKHNIQFGIDSVLVSKWKKELIEECVDPLALVGEEGKYSCYLDSVKMTIHKSSFSKEAGIQLTGEEKDIKEQFATF